MSFELALDYYERSGEIDVMRTVLAVRPFPDFGQPAGADDGLRHYFWLFLFPEPLVYYGATKG